MPIRFHSERAGDVVMLSDVGLRFIRMMGHSGAVPGAIAAEDVPQALAKLKAGLAAAAEDTPATGAQDEEDEPPVTLRQRALPLVDMLEQVIADGSYLAWE